MKILVSHWLRGAEDNPLLAGQTPAVQRLEFLYPAAASAKLAKQLFPVTTGLLNWAQRFYQKSFWVCK